MQSCAKWVVRLVVISNYEASRLVVGTKECPTGTHCSVLALFPGSPPYFSFHHRRAGGEPGNSWVLVVEPAKNSICRHIQLAHNVGLSLLAKNSICTKHFVKRPTQVHVRTHGSLILILSQIEDMKVFFKSTQGVLWTAIGQHFVTLVCTT